MMGPMMRSILLIGLIFILITPNLVELHKGFVDYDDWRKSTLRFSHNDSLIVNLPGLTSRPTFRHYSGYLKATGTRKLFYWFVESNRSPKNDPLVLWLNGGPGCSTVDGLLMQHGPFMMNDDGATLRKNPYSWNKVANMLYVDAPAGVGFSYSDDGDYVTSDDQTSLDNYWALKDFFQKYPEFAANEFFIGAESYGGVYVPTLAERILEDSSFNMKGFSIGNSFSDSVLDRNSIMYFIYYHGIIDQKLWLSLVEACCANGNSTTGNCDFTTKNVETKCLSLFRKAYSQMNHLNPYNIYKECYEPPADEDETHSSQQSRREFTLENDGLKGGYPCLNTTAETIYLNNPAVRRALHVKDNLPDWTVCNDKIFKSYQQQYKSMRNHYLKILATKRVRILLYNGDMDSVCNYISDEWFVDSLEQQLVKPWQHWYYTGQYGTEQVAGSAKHYENIIYATVKGAGHSTPIDKPEQSFELFSKFLNNSF